MEIFFFHTLSCHHYFIIISILCFRNVPKPFTYCLMRLLVVSKLQRVAGLDRCRFAFSCAAPLSTEMKQYFLSLDIPVCEVCFPNLKLKEWKLIFSQIDRKILNPLYHCASVVNTLDKWCREARK